MLPGWAGVMYVELAAEQGRLCMAGRGDLVVVVVTDARATTGLLRAVLLRRLEGLS